MADLGAEVAGVRLRNPTMLASGFLDERDPPRSPSE